MSPPYQNLDQNQIVDFLLELTEGVVIALAANGSHLDYFP